MASHINNPDFEPVVLRKSPPKKNTSNNFQISHQAKIENSVDTHQAQKYTNDFIKKMTTFRSGKGWNQQQFAMNLNMPHKTIQAIEANTVPYNSSYVQKINNYISRNVAKV
jgi:ribosome-binding protein aMBF1 (putative translation factor)